MIDKLKQPNEPMKGVSARLAGNVATDLAVLPAEIAYIPTYSAKTPFSSDGHGGEVKRLVIIMMTVMMVMVMTKRVQC